jgi:hypothetical protein
MVRRSSALVLGAALLASAAGCRSCGDRGWFSSHAAPPGGSPCALVGSGAKPLEGCYDAVTGQPCPCPPATGVIPGGAYPLPAPGGLGTPPNELPFPSPGDMIPRPGVPFAPPSPAPGDGMGVSVKDATTVKGTTK